MYQRLQFTRHYQNTYDVSSSFESRFEHLDHLPQELVDLILAVSEVST